MKNKLKTLNGGQEEDGVWWSKGFRGKKGSSKGKNNLPEGDSRTYHQEKGTGKEYHSYKGRGKDQKRKGKENSRNVDSLQ